MKTRTLQEIKDELAIELNWENYHDFIHNHSIVEVNEFINEVCRRAQLECGRATLEQASHKLTGVIDTQKAFELGFTKTKFTSESNIVIIE
jgi:hypothetical protein